MFVPAKNTVVKKPMTGWLLVSVVLSATLMFPQSARADAGVPMLALMAVPMWLSLLVIIPLEAMIARKTLAASWSTCLKVSSLANAASTLIGVPITWCLLVALEYAGYALVPIGLNALGPKTETISLAQPAAKAFLAVLTSPWLLPLETDLYWMVPTAALLLCVPFFFVSVWSEQLVARKLLGSEFIQQVRDWSWKANIASYSLMVFLLFGLLITSVVGHYRIANDDEHRDVDLVSGDRLWEIAVDRVPKRKEQQEKWLSRNKIDTPERRQPKPTEIDECISEKRYSDAAKLLEKSMMLEDIRLQNNRDKYLTLKYDLRLGEVYQKIGATTKAEEFYQHVLKRFDELNKPDEEFKLRALLALADLYNANNQPQHAEDTYKKAVSAVTRWTMFRNGELAGIQLAKFYCSQKRYNEAEHLLLDVIKEKESCYHEGEFVTHSAISRLALALGQCYLDKGNMAQAEHWIKLALRGDDALPEAATAYSHLMSKQGRSDQAKVWEDRANNSTSL